MRTGRWAGEMAFGNNVEDGNTAEGSEEIWCVCVGVRPGAVWLSLVWSVVVVVSRNITGRDAAPLTFWVAFHTPATAASLLFDSSLFLLPFHELLLLCHSSSTLVLQLYLRYGDW